MLIPCHGNFRLLITGLFFVLLLYSCSKKTERPEPPASELSGKMLAEQYCSGCHSLVTPDLLPRSVWQHMVLPVMGYRLGIADDLPATDSLFDLSIDDPVLREANIPVKPVMARSDWAKIVDYYLQNAPDTILPTRRKQPITIGLKHFSYQRVPYSHTPANTAMVKILSGNRGLVFSDGKQNVNRLTFLTEELKKDYELTFQKVPVHFHETGENTYLATIGENIFPSHAADGILYQLQKDAPGSNYGSLQPVLEGLQRPVAFEYGDLTNNGLEDIVVCEFGNLTGMLCWFENLGNGNYSKQALRNQPGAVKTILKDFNHDGYLDILALMAQGDEGIFLYQNLGNSTFHEIPVLSFSPLFGSQYMELADFNSDGKEDILYVCGDNADKSPILKDYHGVYIFLNNGGYNFKQAYFYHLNGAYKAIPRDYDLDGDLDIATISFYPDYQNYPEESFIYLENNGQMEFAEYSFPQAIDGRWIVMDAADMDDDGDIDLALGSNVYFSPKNSAAGLAGKWSEIGPSVIVLKNTIR